MRNFGRINAIYNFLRNYGQEDFIYKCFGIAN